MCGNDSFVFSNIALLNLAQRGTAYPAAADRNNFLPAWDSIFVGVQLSDEQVNCFGAKYFCVGIDSGQLA